MARGLFGVLARPEAKSAVDDGEWWKRLLGLGAQSKAGVSVNLDTALRVSTVMACARVLAEGIAQLPLKLYREKADGGREVAADHPLHALLSRRPNSWMTSFEFRETMTMHAVLTGNAFAVKVTVGSEVRELLPVVPGNVTIERQPDWSVLYKIQDKDGPIGNFTADKVFHLRGPSWNGYCGLDMVKEAREAIGLAIATEENHSRLFSNGTRPSGILSVENALDQEAIERLRTAWQAGYAGLANASKTIVLDNGAKWSSMAMTGVDAQAIEARKHQIEEICRALRVFPLMVGYSDKTATFASAEQFFLAHVVHSLGPWIERWEQTIDRDLIPARETNLYAKFSVQGLLRGDAKARAEFYTKLYGIGAINPNEIRALEEMNPYEGGEQYRVPLNMVDTGSDEAAGREAGDADARHHRPGERKAGRVLSAANEDRIVTARDKLTEVLDTLPAQDGGADGSA